MQKEKRIQSNERIGPHNYDILTIKFGTLLGDGHLEKRSIKGGTRFKLTQCNANVEYLRSFHNFFAIRGYCNTKKPNLTVRPVKDKRLKKGFEYNLNTYTYKSLNWLYEIFYKNNKKIKPNKENLDKYFTSLALAHLFMNDGSR
jgi:hypothetical protein